ncbi:uncharacterized protein TM35_000011280 [Trypanosoma theileri]|uniref:Uncharacterized protein n=1 Tax=Trypanosoma theileri TaxID=67003 RepID=A0A1X0P8T9_9TRYP|nr:uncharacterized protein TM35_000011280 [Trypanosoma theileri]ORC93251.1 hypothetical protein TM35_000011280 [Trypanosoma theileri]
MTSKSSGGEEDGGIRNGQASSDFPTLTEAATVVLTEEELLNLRRNLTEEKIAHAKYLRSHPEIDAIMRCAMQMLIMQRPDDPVSDLLEFFANTDLKAVLQAKEEERVRKEALVKQQHEVMRALPP